MTECETIAGLSATINELMSNIDEIDEELVNVLALLGIVPVPEGSATITSAFDQNSRPIGYSIYRIDELNGRLRIIVARINQAAEELELL